MKSPNLPIYLDYNATTPVDERVLETMMPWFCERFGNAASANHSFGWQAAKAVELSREKVAALVNAEPAEIVFTSGATEAINLGIKGVASAYQKKGNHIITCQTEHKAVLDSCEFLEKHGFEITRLGVNGDGEIDLEKLEVTISENTILVALMTANNETGALHPVEAINEISIKYNILFLTDASQAVGKLPFDVRTMCNGMAAFSAHKIYGPKGMGALVVSRKNPRVNLIPSIHGGGHEKDRRSGTLNVPAIVGFGKACELAGREMKTETPRIKSLRNRLENLLLEIPGAKLNGPKKNRLANVSNLCFENINANDLLMALASKVAVSSGSACTSANPQPSHVLQAMGLSKAEASTSIRLSLGRLTSIEEIEFVAQTIKETVERLR